MSTVKILAALSAVVAVAAAGVLTVNWVNSLETGDAVGREPLPTKSPAAVPSPTALPPSSAPSPSPSLSPSPTPISVEAGPETDFAAKLDLLRAAVGEVCAGGGSRTLTLTFTEAEANEQAAAYLGTYDMAEGISLEVRDAAIDFRDGNKIYGVFKTKAAFITTDVKVQAEVSLVDGEPVVALEKVNFGFLPLPGAVKDRVIALAEQKIAALKESYLGINAGCPAAVKLRFTGLVITADTASFTVVIFGESGLP